MDVLTSVDMASWAGPFAPELQNSAIEALERGRLVLISCLDFPLSNDERRFLSPQWSDSGAKNISHDPNNGELRGTTLQGGDRLALQEMGARYAEMTRQLIEGLFPSYRTHLTRARTSFRPVGVVGRVTSYRKDDRRLHTDAFPSRPTRGARILRVFSNVNPEGEERVWRVGEPFETFARTFLPLVRPAWPGWHRLLATLGITKGQRALYDHLMLQLHDAVKRDMRYQREAPQERLELPAGSTWIVYSDQVLHAAVSGQYLFEQTFHLPVSVQRWPETSPLRVLERLTGRTLTE